MHSRNGDALQSFTYRGHAVRYLDVGKGIPIVFLHNAGTDHRIWDYQIARFRQTHRVIALDQLGYGMSDHPMINYSLHLYADFLRKFLEHLKAGPSILIGNCIGSAMSLRFALEFPERVRGLILFNVATEQTLQRGVFGYMYRMIQNRPRIRNIFGHVAEIEGFAKMVRAMGFGILYGKKGEPSPEFGEHLLSLYRSPEQMPIMYNLLTNFASFRMLDGFRRPASLPSCRIVWGRQNRILPLGGGVEFCARFDPDELRIIDDCGHLLMRERHDEVNDLIAGFLFNDGALYGKE